MLNLSLNLNLNLFLWQGHAFREQEGHLAAIKSAGILEVHGSGQGREKSLSFAQPQPTNARRGLARATLPALALSAGTFS